MPNKLTVADFFCGCGGFSEGFHQSGFEIKFSLDNWKLATETHDINHPDSKCTHMDITDISNDKIDEIIPDTDIIIGSPPCVSFSNSNKSGNADKTLGHKLILQFLKIVLHKKTKPNSKLKYWIMENVPNSLKFLECDTCCAIDKYNKDIDEFKKLNKEEKTNEKRKKYLFESICKSSVSEITTELQIVNAKPKERYTYCFHTKIFTALELGLDKSLPDLEIPKKFILNASDYGSPQDRKRAIVGQFVEPTKTHKKRVDGNKTFIDPDDNDKLTDKIYIEDICTMLGPPDILNNTKTQIKDILFENIELDKDDLTDHFYNSTIPEVLWSKAKKLKTDHGFMGKMEFPDSLNRSCRTIMATESYCSRESIIFPKEDGTGYRGPTIRELSSLMGFPLDYQFKGSHNNKHKQIGNAVCVQLSYALGKAILDSKKIKIKKVQQRNNGNLEGNQTKPLFDNYIEKPKKINSVYKKHIPDLKIKQFRVELNNNTNNFKDEQSIKDIKQQNIDNINIKWNTKLHKGSGKTAKFIELSNDDIIEYLDESKLNKLKKILDEKCIINFTHVDFQVKFYELSKDLSPDNVLDIIKDLLDIEVESYDISVPIANTIYNIFWTDVNKKEKYINSKILYGLYCLNYVLTKLK